MLTLAAVGGEPGRARPARLLCPLDYLEYVRDQATARYNTGMSPQDARRDISLGRFGALDEKGRLAHNVLSVYHELDPALERVDTREVFRRIAELEGFTA